MMLSRSTIWPPWSVFSDEWNENIDISSMYTNVAWIYLHRIIASHETNTIQVCGCFFHALVTIKFTKIR